jgi:hypothetical protein
MQNHPTEDELVRLCLARSEDPGAPETRTHIEGGCPECGERVRELRVVLASLAAPALREVPEAMFHRSLAWVLAQERVSAQERASAQESATAQTTATEAASSTATSRAFHRSAPAVLQGVADLAARFLEEIRASLVLDSPAGAVLPGVRGSATANTRQLLYESPAGSVLLLVEPAGVGPTKVLGQFLPADGSAPAVGARVVIEVGGRETVVLLSSTGEFRFDGGSSGTIRLSVENGASRVVLDPIEP